jgi:hypothetical protein
MQYCWYGSILFEEKVSIQITLTRIGNIEQLVIIFW